MKVEVKVHLAARDAFASWRRGLSADPHERRRLAHQYFEIAENELRATAGKPANAEPITNWRPSLFVWESPTAGMFLIYAVRDLGSRFLRWIGLGTREVIILSVQPRRPSRGELETLATTLRSQG
jgi:hypothetical protein